MPTTSTGSSSVKVDLFNSSSTGQNTFSQTFSVTQPERLVRTYDATVRRPRPTDLFMGGTSRSYTTYGNRNAQFDWRTTDPGNSGQLWTNYPVLVMYPDSGGNRVDSSGASIPDPDSSLNRERLYNRIRNDLRGQEVNLGNMLGEYRQTAQLFLDMARVVSSRGKSLLKRHPGIHPKRGKPDLSGSAANAWLQFQYGIKPLAQDLGTAAGEIVSSINQRPPFIEGKVRQRNRATGSGYILPNSTIFSRWGLSDVTRESVQATRYRAYFSGNPLVACLAQHGLLNPAALAWELTPYSFVVDWFFNVGDVLASMDNLLIYDSLWVIDSSSERRYEYVQPNIRPNVLSRPVAFRYRRTDTRSAPHTISLVCTPAYKPGISVGHILNGMALLAQAVGRRL